MTFKELEWKKVKELISPFAENWMTSTFGVSAIFEGYVLFSYFGEHNMCVHYITEFSNEGVRDWTYTVCKNYFDVLRLLPKIRDTFLEIKFPSYHEKLKRIQDDC